MLRIGIVGIGFMGMIHYLAARRLKGAQVTAICSRDAKKLAGDWRSIQGNFGPTGEMMDLSGVKKYDQWRDMLIDPEIDMVDICVPTHLHKNTAIHALEAGKHVLVEKAMALLPEEADAMLASARRTKKLLMVAHVLPFFPEFGFAADYIKSGKGGKVLAAHFTRVISKPDWSAEIADAAKTGGPAVDLHIHDTHFIGLACGVPKEVFSRGVVENGTVVHLTTQYLYENGPGCVTCTSGAICQSGRPFVHGFEIYLERATLLYSSGTQPLRVLTPPLTKRGPGGVETPQFSGGDDATTAFTAEIQTAVDAIAAGKEPALLSGQLARDALVMCHKECESVVSGRPVRL